MEEELQKDEKRVIDARDAYREANARVEQYWGQENMRASVSMYNGKMDGLRSVFTQDELAPSSPKTDYFIHEFNKLLKKYDITIQMTGGGYEDEFGFLISAEGEYGALQYTDHLDKTNPLKHCIEQTFNKREVRDFDKEIEEFEKQQINGTEE